jgi:Family of unknown function (DUF6152)
MISSASRRLTMQLKTLGAAVICALALAVPLAAHHYDLSKWTNMEGVVKQVILVVPHSIVYMDMKNEKGEVVTWSLEATGIRGVLANGVKKEDVQAGDRIKVRCHLLRDGSPGCLLGFITPDHGDSARGHGVEREWD